MLSGARRWARLLPPRAFRGGTNASRSRDQRRAQRFAQAAGVTAAREAEREGVGGLRRGKQEM